MIEAFSLRTAHLFGDALASQARLRFTVFVNQRGLDHRFFEDMEYDEFDTPGSVYFVWRDKDEIVRGLLRLLPTTIPYMLKTYWPHLVEGGELPASPRIREVTRICVDRGYNSHVRLRIMPELLCALQEYCGAHDITHVIGVTRTHLIAHFIREGITWLGKEDLIEGELERAFTVPLKHMRPEYHCRKFGIKAPVLTLTPKDARRVAA
jgi:N-acyl-L-homoserine lactone synthetase